MYEEYLSYEKIYTYILYVYIHICVYIYMYTKKYTYTYKYIHRIYMLRLSQNSINILMYKRALCTFLKKSQPKKSNN